MTLEETQFPYLQIHRWNNKQVFTDMDIGSPFHGFFFETSGSTKTPQIWLWKQKTQTT
jgi:hypothetical protein